MRVIVTHHVTDDFRALAIGPAGDHAAFLAGEKDAPMDGFEPVPYIGKCARHDHAHRVIEITRLHLIDDVDPFDIRSGCRGGRGECVGVVAHGKTGLSYIKILDFPTRPTGQERPAEPAG